MDTSLKNQTVKVSPLKREWIVAIVGLLLIPLCYVIFLSPSSNYPQNQRYGIIVLSVLILFFFIRTLLFKMEANDTGIVTCHLLVPRRFSYEQVDKLRVVDHATKPTCTVEIYAGGKRVAFYNDLCKGSDLFIEKLRQHSIPIEEKRSV